MPRSEALKQAQLKYRLKDEKYKNIKSINARSNKKRYAEDEEFREKMKARSAEQYKIKKEKKLKEKELLEKLKDEPKDLL
tara:strand:- start:338 stop:577 length:240 start_codon:yes stop_codon:yes gene_type:complete